MDGNENMKPMKNRSIGRIDMYVKGNVGVLLRADPKTRAEFFEKMIQNAVYCPDECRAMEERNPIPDGMGKKFLVTKNLGSLESVLEGGEGNG